MHGGSLQARSEGPNRGSEFTLSLPVFAHAQNTASRRRARPREEPAVAGIPRRVLLLDDNIDATAALDLLLKSLGHETCVVHDGQSALEKAVEFDPDVIFLDIGMPGLDGYEVAKRLRRLKKKSVRIVAVTGWGQEAVKRRSREAGFDLHLVKPVEPGDVAQALSPRGGATLH